jgi:hypothetical protein
MAEQDHPPGKQSDVPHPESEFGGFYLDLLSQLLEVCTGVEAVNTHDLEFVIIRLTTIMNNNDPKNGV